MFELRAFVIHQSGRRRQRRPGGRCPDI